MALATSLLSEEQFLCPICLDVFSHPVTTPCGHNFCRDCIRGYWQSTSQCQCPMCKHKFYRRPELKVNTFISEMAAQFRRSVETRTSSDLDNAPAQPGEVPCDVCTDRRVKARKSCLDCLASYCEAHLEPHHILASFKKHRLMEPVMSVQDRVCQKHDRLLELFCRTDQMFACQVCRKHEHKAHHTVGIEKESSERKAQLEKAEAEVQRLIQGRLQRVCEVKRVLQLGRGNAEREMEEVLQVFSALVSSLQKSQAELVDVIEGKQREAERRAQLLVAELELEIEELSRRGAELERLSRTEDHLHVLQSFPAVSKPSPNRDLCETSPVHSVIYVGTVRRALRRAGAQLEETLKAEVKRLCELEIKRIQQCAVDLTLDPDTAHPKLMISKDRKQVWHGDLALSLPDNPERFYPGISVLGKEGFSSGRFYYEVQVKGKTEWDIGVGRESVNRKGGNTLSPDGGYWTLGLRNGTEYWALTSPPVPLPLPDKPQKVGVYVDLEGGQVSFYNVEFHSHIYSFTGYCFLERLFPYFNPRRNNGGVNSAPLAISTVSSISRD